MLLSQQQYQINCRTLIIIQKVLKMSNLLNELPRIVLTIPCDQYLIITHPFSSSTCASPIKQFDIESTIEQAARDYEVKFGQDTTNNSHHCIPLTHNTQISDITSLLTVNSINQYCTNTDIQYKNSSPRRRLNLGQKVRSKLQTTTNKSPPISISYLKEQGTHTTPFDVSFGNGEIQSLADNQQQLYQSACVYNMDNYGNNNKQQSQSQCQNQSYMQSHPVPLAQSSVVQQSDQQLLINDTNIHDNEHKHPQVQLKMKCSVSSSPYNNMSAKTQNSPIDLQSNESPIIKLQSMADSQRSTDRQIQVLFKGSTDLLQNKQEYNVAKVSQFDSQRLSIKLHRVEDQQLIRNIEVEDIPVVRSRVIEHEYTSSIQAVQSRCIPCTDDDDHCEDWIKSYQFAMQQLTLLSENVCHLESATANLAAIKNNRKLHNSLIPSTIGRGSRQGNSLDESFVKLLEGLDQQNDHQILTQNNQSNIKVLQNSNLKGIDKGMSPKLRINLVEKFEAFLPIRPGKQNRVINL